MLAILILFSSPRSLEAQETHIHFEHITSADGLAQDAVITIYQDHQGVMWFGTLDGPTRYDGYGFKNYRNESAGANSSYYNYITAIYEDRYDTLWVGTDAGLYQLDRRTGRFRRFGVEKIAAICEDKRGNLWVGTQGFSICRYERKTGRFVKYGRDPKDPDGLSSKNVEAICVDPAGTLWIATFNHGLYAFEPEQERFTHYMRDTSRPSSLNSNNVWALCGYRDGEDWTLWVGTDAGLSRLIRRGNNDVEFVHYQHDPNRPGSLAAGPVHSIVYEQGTKTVWVGTLGGGLSTLKDKDVEEGRFSHYRHDPGDPTSLSNDNVWKIFEDASGMLWAGTKGGGVNKFVPSRSGFKQYRHDEADPNSLGHNVVWAFYEDRQGTLWVGTQGGLSRMQRGDDNGARFTNYDLDRYPVRAICEDRSGELWVGTLGGGVGRFDRRTGEVTYYRHDADDPSSLSNDNVYVVCEDRSGRVWVGSNGGGLSRLRRENGTVSFLNSAYDKDPPSPPSGWVTAIFQSRGWNSALWIGTWEGGLIQFDAKTGPVAPYWNDPADPNSISNNSIMSILEDENGDLWIGTYGGGLCRMRRDEEGHVTFKCYTENDGLPNDVVYSILEDDSGNLWMSTNKGLSRLDPRTGVFASYDVGDGLQGNEFNLGAGYKSRSGELFFGGTNGFNSFHPDEFVNPVPPMVALTAFKEFGKEVDLGVPISRTRQIRLPYNENFFSFEFVALHYKDPARNRYAYKLEGLDRKWIDAGTKREAIYTNVDPGHYTFRVKAANSDGVWNEEGVSVEIVIVPPLWRTWWFYGVISAFIMSTAVLVHRYRVGVNLRIERARTAERDRFREELWLNFHDELGHRVTNILGSIRELKGMGGKILPGMAGHRERIAGHAARLSKEMKDVLWELDPEKDSLGDLAIELKDFSDQLFDKADIAFQLQGVVDELEEVRLPLEWRHHLARIYKEALHNVLKHSGCRNVTLEFVLDNDQLSITLRDDGRGCDLTECPPGYGLANMRLRAGRLGGELDIVSARGSGCSVRFSGKLP